MIASDLFITEKDTIISAMKTLDETAQKVLFVVREEKLVASLTDGDVRRWILAGGKLDESVMKAANPNPFWILESDSSKLKELFSEKMITAIPVVDQQHHIVRIAFSEGNEVNAKAESLRDVPVVIMAGGLGTRLYPYTKILPKTLIPVGDVPISEHIMNAFHEYGVCDFRMVVNYKKSMIKAYFNETQLPYSISFYDEEKPLGTGGGVKLLDQTIDSTFILSNCDILIKTDYEEIVREHKKQGNLITMVCSTKKFVVPYGIIELDKTGQIEAMREKPELSFLTNTGCYVVEPEVLEFIPKDTEIGFPDIMEKLRQAGEKVGIYPISDSAWYDMGQMDELKRMEQMLIKG